MISTSSNRNNSDTSDFYDDQDSNNGSITDQIDLQHYLRTLRKYKWAIVLFSAIVTALAAYYAINATPYYRSTSTLLIESQGNNLVQFEELVGLDTDNQDYYQTQYELLRSRGLAVRVINHMGLWDNPELNNIVEAVPSEQVNGGEQGNVLNRFKGFLSAYLPFFAGDSNGDEALTTLALGSSGDDSPESVATEFVSPALELNEGLDEVPTIFLDLNTVLAADQTLTQERQLVVNRFMSRLSVTPVRKTTLVNISFESSDPVFAANVANTVGEQYIESFLDAKLELTTKASTWLNERLGDLKSVLEESESRLIQFKQENGLVDVDGSVGRLNEQELFLATAELAQARSELAAQADLFRDVQSLGGNVALLESIPAIQADPLVQRVKIEQGQAQRALDELRNRYGDRHPRVVDANSQLETLNSTLQGRINLVVSTISKDYQSVRQKVASIESKLASGKQEIQSIGTKKFELDELEREVQTNREIYNTFFSRITEAKSADGLESANARISDPAIPAIAPFKPQKNLIVALAALASMVLSMLMAFLYEQMDDTVRSTADVEQKLGMRLLGILPLVKGGMFSRTSTLPLNPEQIPDHQGRFSESVNTVRTALFMDEKEKPRNIIMVTSSIPGEGKSSTSINLAYSLAQLERVLVIDCDMRRPTLAKAAGFDKNVPGLSSLIAQTASAKDCIQRGAYGGSVDILPSGPIPAHPLELLSSKRFENIVDQLSKHYGRIIIDCPPTQAVSDAFVISRCCNALIYCIKSQDTSMDLVRRGIQRLKQLNAPIVGVVITQVDIDKITSYGGDYYYQGYYDYYGYTEKGSDLSKGGKLRLTQEELHHIRTDDNEVELDMGFMTSSNSQDVGLSESQEFGEAFDQTAKFYRKPSNEGKGARGSNPTSGKKEPRLRNDLDFL